MPPALPRGMLCLLLAAALVPRMLLLPLPNADRDFFLHTWSQIVAVQGIHTIYDDDGSEDANRKCFYPPGYLYVLWATAKLYARFWSPELAVHTIAYLILLRIPTVLADIAVALLVYRALTRWGEPRAARWALVAALFSPAMILDSTIVTQIDAVQSLLGLASVLLLIERRPVAASACLALGVLTKPQLVVLGPLFLAVMLRRDGWRAPLRGAAAALAVAAVLCAPFVLHGRVALLVRTLTGVVGALPWVSLNAWNAWWLLSGGDGWVPDTAPAIGPISFRQLGVTLLALAVGLGVRKALRDPGRESTLLAAAWTILAFFMVSTEVTERHALGVLPFLLLLAASERAYAALFGVLSLTLFVNLYLEFPLVRLSPWEALSLPHSNYYHYRPPAFEPLTFLVPESQAFHDATSLTVAAVNVAAFAWLALRVARVTRPAAA